jgi:ubiquinone/menaquinone biosynthesis C-methylase UbiE
MAKIKQNSTTRFSDRVEFYIKYRPHYPAEILGVFGNELGLTSSSFIADVGSGTGFLSEMFLDNGNRVYGVEPNKEMREAAEKLLKNYWKFRSVNGSAEETTLPRRSIDFITVGQAFHWFDIEKARVEFTRILKPDGWLVLIWNERLADATPFLQAYERILLKYSINYQQVNHRNVNNQILDSFFGKGKYGIKIFKNSQEFDFKGLKGRLLSSSYIPMEEHSQYESMITELKVIFKSHKKAGRICFEYDTKVYFGKLK